MWIGTPGSFVTAAPDSRVLWTSAARGVMRATASHQVHTVQTHTPRNVGCLLTKATATQFKSLGANVNIDTVCDVGGDVRMFESLDQENYDRGIRTDMMYDLTINDSEATVYTARVYLDDAMLRSCVGERGVPMALYAVQNLDSLRESLPEVAEVLQRAFGTGSVENTSAEPAVHCVASAGSTSRRMFPIGLNVGSTTIPCSMLGTLTDKTILFNTDREITHHITTYSARATDMSTDTSRGPGRYLVAQNMKIEDVGGVYSANVTMSIVGTDVCGSVARSDAVTHKMNPYTSIENDPGLVTRTSTIHVFTNGKHYSMLATHLHNSNSMRSLQLTAYASLNALHMSGKEPKSDIDRIMKSASMETLFDSSGIPVVVARKSSSPFICVIVPGGVTGTMESALSSPCSTSSFERKDFRMREDEKCHLVNMKTPVCTLDIKSLPGPIQNALRRQWGS